MRYDLNQITNDYTVEVTHRFKGLDLIERVPEELWMEVHNIVQEVLIKAIHPQEEEMQKGKMAVWGVLTDSWEKKRNERQRKKETSTHLNTEFQRRARRDKKAFLSDQCKEMEKTNRMGKARDLFKKIRDTKQTFYAKMGTIKDRNGMDLTEAEDIKEEVARIHRRTVRKRSLWAR